MSDESRTNTPAAGAADMPPELDPDLLPLRPLTHHLALCIYWLGNSLLWGALLHLGIQSRLNLWFAEDRVGHYLGILGAIGGVVGAVTQLVAGACSDRSLNPWGRRRPFLLAGSTLAGVTLLILGRSDTFWFMLIALAAVQFSTNIALAPFTALLRDTVNPREHGKASAFMGAARLVGDFGGIFVASLLLTANAVQGQPIAEQMAYLNPRWFTLCAGMGGLLLVGAIITCITIRETPLRSRPAQTVLETLRNSFAVDLRSNRSFAWLTLSRAVTNLGFYIFLEVFFFYCADSLKMPDPETASRNMLIPAILVAGLASIPSGILSDRIGRRKLIFISQFFLAAAAATYMLAPNATVAFIASFPAGFAYGVFTAVEWALACNLLPKNESAKYMAVWNLSSVVPQVLAFPLGGYIGSALARYGGGLGWRVDFGVTVLCCIAGALFLAHVREPKFRAGEPTPPALH